MRTLKEICGLLIVVGIIAVFGQFLPGLNVLFDDYFAGFLLVAIVIPVARMMYNSHMDKIATLSPEVRQKKEKESQEQWEETCEATFSLSEPLDLRNMINDD
ncbi:MAG: hypothetical protein L3J84_08075 [Gammaproteobacteria bacterium]|nr:hypothetical protein [Gammaproteobacteria bacterium]